MSDSMLDIFTENSDRRLDAVLFADREYRRAGRRMDHCFRKLEKAGLTKKQEYAVDRLLSAYNAENACCSRIFYRQGFKDCIALLKEIGVIC